MFCADQRSTDSADLDTCCSPLILAIAVRGIAQPRQRAPVNIIVRFVGLRRSGLTWYQFDFESLSRGSAWTKFRLTRVQRTPTQGRTRIKGDTVKGAHGSRAHTVKGCTQLLACGGVPNSSGGVPNSSQAHQFLEKNGGAPVAISDLVTATLRYCTGTWHLSAKRSNESLPAPELCQSV